MSNENKTETKLCKHCQSEIPKKAKVCPQCRKKQKGGILKWIGIGIVVLVIISVVAGGGGSSKKEETAKTSDSAKEENTNASETQEQEQNSDSENSEDTNRPEISFEEITVVNNSECVIKITDIKPEDMWGYALKAYLENKSADKTYMFSVKHAAINGVQCDPLFATEVAAGKKANEDISFMSSSRLEENGITDFTDIELSFRVYDSNNWAADEVAEETVHVYPYGEENAKKFERQAQSTDTVLFDNEYVTVIVTGYEQDDIWGYTANLYLVNKTDVEVMFSVDESSVNGYMVEPFWANSVAAGKSAFASISWSDTSLEENGITEVEQIEMLFKAHDSNDFMKDDFVNETVTLNP